MIKGRGEGQLRTSFSDKMLLDVAELEDKPSPLSSGWVEM